MKQNGETSRIVNHSHQPATAITGISGLSFPAVEPMQLNEPIVSLKNDGPMPRPFVLQEKRASTITGTIPERFVPNLQMVKKETPESNIVQRVFIVEKNPMKEKSVDKVRRFILREHSSLLTDFDNVQNDTKKEKIDDWLLKNKVEKEYAQIISQHIDTDKEEEADTDNSIAIPDTVKPIPISSRRKRKRQEDENNNNAVTPVKQGAPGKSSHKGTHDDRRFVSNLNIRFNGKKIEGDNPLKKHLLLRDGLGRGVGKLSENQVNASIGIILSDSSGNSRMISTRIDKTFTSGEHKNKKYVKSLKESLLENGIISNPEEYDSGPHAHSEQELAIYLKDNCEMLAEKLAMLTGNKKGIVECVILDLVSIPNTICNPCHRSLEALFRSGSDWANRFLGFLYKKSLRGAKNVKTIIRASAENLFLGAITQHGDAVKNNEIESDVDIGDGMTFLENLTDLAAVIKTRDKFVEEVRNRTLNGSKITLKINDKIDIRVKSNWRKGDIEACIGAEYIAGDHRFKIIEFSRVEAKKKGNAAENTVSVEYLGETANKNKRKK